MEKGNQKEKEKWRKWAVYTDDISEMLHVQQYLVRISLSIVLCKKKKVIEIRKYLKGYVKLYSSSEERKKISEEVNSTITVK